MNNELWAYDEPHESGGNCHVTMTREQAVAMQRRQYPYDTDDAAFNDWQLVNWAYPVSDTIPRATVAAALEELRAKVASERKTLYGFVVEEIDAAIAALGLGSKEAE